MNFMDLANIRQSDRTFTTQKVERAELLKCLQAAQTAPSARNLQPWKFIILDDPELVQQAAAIIAENKLGINKFAQTAPVLVAVVEEPNSAAPDTPNKWVQFDLGSATEHFCLQAAELGLGTCIMGAFHEEKMKNLLHVPQERRIFVMLAVGYPAEETRTKTRKELNAIHCFNQYEA